MWILRKTYSDKYSIIHFTLHESNHILYLKNKNLQSMQMLDCSRLDSKLQMRTKSLTVFESDCLTGKLHADGL